MRRVTKKKPNADVYALKRDYLLELETLSECGAIDLFYGDESRVSLQPCVPYAWQFKDETVGMPSTQGGGVNCFGLLARDNRCHACLTEGKITGAWIADTLDLFSLSLSKPTVVVLDNATAHKKAVKERGVLWQERGLFVLFLPPYSPHLNLAETLWKRLKYEWLRPDDYADKDTLHFAVWKALKAVGTTLHINFAKPKQANAF